LTNKFVKNHGFGSPHTSEVKRQIEMNPHGITSGQIGKNLGITTCTVINAINCCDDIAEDDNGNLSIVRW